MRIAELERWVCEAAGEAGWLRPSGRQGNWRVAVVGSGAAGLTCAYYLSFLGGHVDLYDAGDQPGAELWRIPQDRLPRPVLERTLQAILRNLNIRFQDHMELGDCLTLRELLGSHEAIYLAPESTASAASHLAKILGPDWRTRIDPATGAAQGYTGLYVGGALVLPGQSVSQAVADGRRVAVAISARR